MTRYSAVGIVANPQRPDVPETLGRAVLWLRAHRLDVRIAPDVRDNFRLEIPVFDWHDAGSQVDLLLTFGGDGTILFAARHLAGQRVPIFGVNTGSLGFLTSSSRDSMEESLAELFGGGGLEERYMTLRASVDPAPDDPAREEDGAPIPYAGGGSAVGDAVRPDPGAFRALNDVVVHKGQVTARVLDLRLEVDGEEVGTYVADGLILSTPVGSTGYGLSAQGPLVVPTMEAIVATPICPHTLAIRPLVLPPDATIRVTVVEQEEAASLAVDGNVVAELSPGRGVTVTRAESCVVLVRLPGRSFFRLLRSKLHWGGRASHE